MSTLSIQAIKAFQDNYIWAIINTENASVWIVDPGDAIPVISFLQQQQLMLTGILITHHHHDHCGGVAELRQPYDVPVYGPKHADILATHTVTDNQRITLKECGLSFDVLTIPGHTLEHIAYYCAEDNILFCGDTLFSAGCGRVFEGTAEQMTHSLMRLNDLPEETRVYCAHEYTKSNLLFARKIEPDNKDIDKHLISVEECYKQNKPSLPSTLELERKINPFLRIKEKTVIAAAEEYAQEKLSNTVAVFATIRQWKNAG